MTRVVLPVFGAAVVCDLLSKLWATGHADLLVYNPMPSALPRRMLASAMAIVVALLLTRLATRLGLGRQWGVSIGCALLVAGVLANGVSALLWARGVPDFIDVGDGWVWNVADFEIAIGLTGGLVSIGLSAIAVYAREKVGTAT